MGSTKDYALAECPRCYSEVTFPIKEWVLAEHDEDFGIDVWDALLGDATCERGCTLTIDEINDLKENITAYVTRDV